MVDRRIYGNIVIVLGFLLTIIGVATFIFRPSIDWILGAIYTILGGFIMFVGSEME